MDNFNRETVASEKHYATAVIFTVLALYSVSVYSYFSAPAATAVPLSAAQTAEVFNPSVELTQTLTSTNQQTEQLFRPINTDNSVFVPGALCTLTDKNFTPAGTLYQLSPSCDFVARGD